MFKRVTGLEIYTSQLTTPLSSTTSALAAANATTITVVSATNGVDLDPIFINGDGGFELNAIAGAPAGLVLTLKYKLGKAQSAGAAVTEAVKAVVQRMSQDGLGFSPSFSQEPIFSADAAGAVGYFEGNGEFSGSFGLLGLNGPNLALAMGAPPTLETGAGVVNTDPYQVHMGTTDFNTIGSLCIRMLGTRYDGGTFHIDFNDVRIEAAGELRMARGREAIVPISFKFTRYAFRQPV
jgi:hypothetical protein